MTPPRTSRSFLALLLLALAATAGSADLATEPSPAPGVVRQRLAEAYQALESGRLDEAARSFREVLAATPDEVSALLGMARVHELEGDPLEALRLTRQAAHRRPPSAAAILAMARLLALLGLSGEALEALTAARQLDPEEKQGYLLAAFVLRDLGRRDEAIQILEEARSRGVQAPELEEQLVLLLLAANRQAEARELAETALTRQRERAGAQRALGLALATDPQSRGAALAALQRALELGAADPGRVHLEIGGLLLAGERAAEAIEPLERAAELLPESAEVVYRLAAAQRAAGDLAGARQSLARFQELNRRREEEERREIAVGTALNEAQELATADRLAEALERVERLLGDHPDEARAHTLQAKILYSLQRDEAALAAIRRSRRLDPGRVEPHYLEGMFLMEMDRPAEAAAALTRALSLDPGLGPAHLLLGGAAAKQERPLEAVTHFERALELGTDSATLRLGYAAALESLGRTAESEEQIEAYRRLAQRPQ